jgi:hypothetical protein
MVIARRFLRNHLGKVLGLLAIVGFLAVGWWELPPVPRRSWTAPTQCRLCSLSANGETLVTCDGPRYQAGPGPIRLWHVPTTSCALVDLTHGFTDPYAGDVCLSPDGAYLAVTTENPKSFRHGLYLIEIASGKVLLQQEPLSRYPFASFSPDGGFLVFWGSPDGASDGLAVWDVHGRKRKMMLYEDSWRAFDPTGPVLATFGSGHIIVWDFASASRVATTSNVALPVWDMAFDASGKRLTVISFESSRSRSRALTKEHDQPRDDVTVAVYESSSGRELSRNVLHMNSFIVPHTSGAGGPMFFLRREPDERVVLLDAVTGEERGELAGAAEINAHTEFVGQTVDIADNAAVEIPFTVSDGWNIRAHTANAGETLVIAGSTSPNSFWKRVREWFPSWDFAPSDSESILAFYDTTSARRLCVVPGADDYIFSADGKFVATYRNRDR